MTELIVNQHGPIIAGATFDPLTKSDERANLRHDKIARLAYYLWQSGGALSGGAEADWSIAEHIFDTAHFRTMRRLAKKR
jgi:DUF2934 family protein